MAKIVREGQTIEERAIGLTMSCFRDGTAWQTEAGDTYRIHRADGQFYDDRVEMACPHCGMEVSTSIPWRSQR